MPKKQQPKQKKFATARKVVKLVAKALPATSATARALKFARVLKDPFAPASYGAQVPDPFPFPTVTHHIHQTSVLGFNGATTSGSALFLPNPLFSLIDLTGALNNNTSGATLSAVSATGMSRYSSTGATQYNMYSACSLNSIGNLYSQYRVVSWGLKISNLQPELSATGRIMIAFVPIGDEIPSYNTFAGYQRTDGSNLQAFTGVSINALCSSSVLQLPSALEFTVGDLLRSDIEVNGSYTSPDFWNFKSTQSYASPGTATNAGDDFIVNSTLGVANYGYKDPTRMNGGVGIVVYFEGLPATASNAFQVETIYHLEGQPVLSTTSSSVPIPSTKQEPCIGTGTDINYALSITNGVSGAVRMLKKGYAFLEENPSIKNGIYTAAKSFMRRSNRMQIE